MRVLAQSDNQLIKEILKGNESAMELLVKRYYKMVHSFISRYVGDFNIAYDLTQEVFIKIIKNLNRYDYQDNGFNKWALKIASNHCKDYFKSKAYKQRQVSEDINNIEISSSENVIDILEKNEKRSQVIKALNNLPDLQREAIILKYYNDLKIKDISRITGANESTIKSRIFNGIKSLKNIIGGSGDENRKIK